MDDKKIKELLRDYTSIIEKLKKLGATRTANLVQGYGEYVASKKLNLKLTDSPVNKGYDAVDKSGKRYEIKTRKANTWNKPSLFPVNLRQLAVVDFLIFVEFDNEWNITKFLKIPAKKLMSSVNKYDRVAITSELIERFGII